MLIHRSSIEINTRVFVLEKCVRTAAKTMDANKKKKQKALALLYLALGPLPNAANSSDVPTEFAAEHCGKDEVQRKFS